MSLPTALFPQLPAAPRASGHTRAGSKTRVGVSDLAAPARIGARACRSRGAHSGKTSRVRQHASAIPVFENWNRYYDPFSGRYLQPEPLASIVPHAGRLPTYSYAGNNPVLWSDRTGLYQFSDYSKCPNYDAALAKARRLAGCGQCSECSELIKKCGYGDICETLEPGRGPPLQVKDLPFGLDRKGELWYEGGRTVTHGSDFITAMFNVLHVEIAQLNCGDPGRVDNLARTLIHESIHVSDQLAGDWVARDLSHDPGFDCSAENIANTCVEP